MASFGKTRLQIINEVLARLRESSVATSSSTTYASLVAVVLNQVKDQIERAWMWRSLRDTTTVTAVAGTSSYALTSSGQNAVIISAWNSTTGRELSRGTYRSFNERFFGATNGVQTGDVSEFSVAGFDGNLDLQIDVWPVPTRSNVLKVDLYIPQAAPDDNDAIIIPNQVLIEGMVGQLMAERGDDNGTGVQTQMAMYQSMLADAIAQDAGHDESEMAWEPV